MWAYPHYNVIHTNYLGLYHSFRLLHKCVQQCWIFKQLSRDKVVKSGALIHPFQDTKFHVLLLTLDPSLKDFSYEKHGHLQKVLYWGSCLAMAIMLLRFLRGGSHYDMGCLTGFHWQVHGVREVRWCIHRGWRPVWWWGPGNPGWFQRLQEVAWCSGCSGCSSF